MTSNTPMPIAAALEYTSRMIFMSRTPVAQILPCATPIGAEISPRSAWPLRVFVRKLMRHRRRQASPRPKGPSFLEGGDYRTRTPNPEPETPNLERRVDVHRFHLSVRVVFRALKASAPPVVDDEGRPAVVHGAPLIARE